MLLYVRLSLLLASLCLLYLPLSLYVCLSVSRADEGQGLRPSSNTELSLSAFVVMVLLFVPLLILSLLYLLRRLYIYPAHAPSEWQRRRTS